MKKIYFDNLSNFKNSWLSKTVFIVALLCIFSGFIFQAIDAIDDVWIKRIQRFGYILFALYFLNKVFRKNYVQWNKLGMTIRINSYFKEHRLTFSKVKYHTFENNNLTVHQIDNTFTIDLSNTNTSDTDQLIKIITDNTTNK